MRRVWTMAPGELNPMESPSRVIDRVINPMSSDLYRLKRVVNSYYRNENKRSHTGTWKAICLYSLVEYYEAGDAPGSILSEDLGQPMSMVAVVARIPELDFSRAPMPAAIMNPDDMSEEDAEWLNMHRVFRCPLHGRHGVTTIPAPGDIIEVDFEDRNARQGPVYIGLVEKGPGTISDNLEGEEGEAQQAFGSPSTESGTVDSYRTEAESSQAQQMQGEANDAMDEMASELSDATGMSKEQAKAYVEMTVYGQQPPTGGSLISS
jgi:hypothetical protein